MQTWWACEERTHWERPWCWGRLKVGVEGESRGWDGWMASPSQWTWVWARSGDGGQGSLACYSPWGLKESDMTKWLNNDHFPSVRHLPFYPMAIIICVLLLTLFPSRYSGLPGLSHFALLDTHTSLVLFSSNRMPSPSEHLPNSVLTAFKALKRVLQILRLPRTTQVYNSSGSLKFLWFQI